MTNHVNKRESFPVVFIFDVYLDHFFIRETFFGDGIWEFEENIT